MPLVQQPQQQPEPQQTQFLLLLLTIMMTSNETNDNNDNDNNDNNDNTDNNDNNDHNVLTVIGTSPSSSSSSSSSSWTCWCLYELQLQLISTPTNQPTSFLDLPRLAKSSLRAALQVGEILSGGKTDLPKRPHRWHPTTSQARSQLQELILRKHSTEQMQATDETPKETNWGKQLRGWKEKRWKLPKTGRKGKSSTQHWGLF